MEIGERLKKARAAAALTQAQVAAEVHVTRTTISNWETGRSYPDIASLLTLSNLYGLSLDTLIKEDSRMMDDLSKKEQERRRAAWTELTAVAVSAGITLLFLGKKLAVPGVTMGTTTQYGLLALLWLNLVVIGLTAHRVQDLKEPKRRARKAELVVGLVLIAAAVVAALDPQHRLDPLLLGLLAAGAAVMLWHRFRKHQGSL
ncbi:helix-turn-helix transcriptional regulator [Lacticaseibacillus kribbianus]|uniref:helix-turn-helix transcriptional regulator n=1 Tax=Lacticaseibacillus kribbianus TaxID=2926292 RepID=UPI001CD48E3B|nr:helix-turn-helix transcriptional regulator [Lacticaseibacillus kribbianus]